MSQTPSTAGTTSAANKGAKVESYHGWTNGQPERDAGVPAAETREWFVDYALRNRLTILQPDDMVEMLIAHSAAQSQEIVALDKQLAKNLIELNNADDLLTAERERSAKLENELRWIMWGSHGHDGLYGDDGEMQCCQCSKYGCIDYKREPLEKVRSAYASAKLSLLASSQAEGSDYCNNDETAELLNREDKAQTTAPQPDPMNPANQRVNTFLASSYWRDYCAEYKVMEGLPSGDWWGFQWAGYVLSRWEKHSIKIRVAQAQAPTSGDGKSDD